MKEFFQNPATWLTIVSIIIALIALLQTNKQIKLSNKQQLFDRRLQNYLLLESLLGSYRDKQEVLESNQPEKMLNNNNMLAYDLIILTSNEYLDGAHEIAVAPWAYEVKKKFFTKIDALNRAAKESKLIFPDNIAEISSKYISSYSGLIVQIVAYLQGLQKYRNVDLKNNEKATEEIKSWFKVLTMRYNALKEAFETLENSNIESQIEKTIRL